MWPDVLQTRINRMDSEPDSLHQWGGGFRAWDKDDVANVNLRLFVPCVLEDILVVDYLHAILLHHPKMPGNQWRHINNFQQVARNKDGTFPSQNA